MENDQSPNVSDYDAVIRKYSPYFREVRKRVFFTFLVFVFTTLGGFIFYENIIKFIIDILGLKGINIVFTSPFQFINLATTCGITVGLIFVSPLLIGQILSFLRPALKIKEFHRVIRLLPFSIILFLIGFIFGAIIMRWQIQISLAQAVNLGIGNLLDISHLLTTILLTSALMGLGFQFPIILLLLLFLGILNRHQLSRQRPWVYLGAFGFAILLPADSIIADILLALPFIFLFEVTLLTNFISTRGK